VHELIGSLASTSDPGWVQPSHMGRVGPSLKKKFFKKYLKKYVIFRKYFTVF
jgi:hypothetical protein